MKFKADVKFVFSGTIEVEAENSIEAHENIEKHVGLVIGGDIHTTLPDDEVDWEFTVHPEKLITNIEEV